MTAALKGDDRKPIWRGQSLSQNSHCLSDKFYFLTTHWATNINDTDQINTCPWPSARDDLTHGWKNGFLSQFDLRPLSYQWNFNLSFLSNLLDTLYEFLVIIENTRELNIHGLSCSSVCANHVPLGCHLLNGNLHVELGSLVWHHVGVHLLLWISHEGIGRHLGGLLRHLLIVV